MQAGGRAVAGSNPVSPMKSRRFRTLDLIGKVGESRENTGVLGRRFSSVPGCSRHRGPQKDRRRGAAVLFAVGSELASTVSRRLLALTSSFYGSADDPAPPRRQRHASLLSTSMSGGVRAMWNHLAVETDETVVLSVVYECASDQPVLMAASGLIGPAAFAQTGWPGWRLVEGFKPQPQGVEREVSATFMIELDSAVVGRVAMSQSVAYDWVRSVLERGVCPAVGGLPEARASLAPARAPIKVPTHFPTEAGDLATYMTRPITGFHFLRTDEPAGLEAEPQGPG